MRQNITRWKTADRNCFIATLIETGSPETAADAIGQTLASAYQMRDRCPVLQAEWRQALRIIYEQVEMRMLSSLLEGRASTIDSKIALEMLKRRTPAQTRPMVTIDAARISQIRNEIRALAGPEE